jgi:hypothetical protein
VWTEDVLVTRKEACHLEAFRCYIACCSSLACTAELLANLVDGNNLPLLSLNGSVFQFLGSRIFSSAP